MPLITDHPRVPPTGHYFVDSSETTYRAKSIPLLIKAVEKFRLNNSLPAGNPAKEVEDFYAIHFGWLISKEGEMPKDKEEDPMRTWLNRTWRTPPKAHDWAETLKAKERLQVCGRCRFNDASGILSQVNLRRLIILGAGRIAMAASCCKIHGWECGLAVWIERPISLTGEQVPGCWANTGAEPIPEIQPDRT